MHEIGQLSLKSERAIDVLRLSFFWSDFCVGSIPQNCVCKSRSKYTSKFEYGFIMQILTAIRNIHPFIPYQSKVV